MTIFELTHNQYYIILISRYLRKRNYSMLPHLIVAKQKRKYKKNENY